MTDAFKMPADSRSGGEWWGRSHSHRDDNDEILTRALMHHSGREHVVIFLFKYSAMTKHGASDDARILILKFYFSEKS